MNLRTAAATLVLALVNGAAVASLAGDGPEAFTPGSLLVLSAPGGAVAAFDPGGQALPAPVTGLADPVDLAFAPDGTLFISDRGPDAVLVYDAGNHLLEMLGAGAGMVDVAGLAFGPAGHLFVASTGTDRVCAFDRDGVLVQQIGAASGLSAPWGLAFGADGRLYVASSASDRVLAFDPLGTLAGEIGAGSGLVEPHGLAFGPDGRLYVASHGSGRVLVFGADGGLAESWGEGGELVDPDALAFGPDGLLYVSSAGRDEVVVYAAGGLPVATLSDVTGAGGLAFAPSVFQASVKGTLQRPGEARRKVKEQALISVSPGLATVSVRLADPDGDLAATFGSDTLVLPGFWASGDPAGKQRAFAGEQVAPAASLGGLFGPRGLASIQVDAIGQASESPVGGVPGFQLKKLSGLVEQGAPEGVFRGRFQATKTTAP